ncbi:MAG: glycerate kinase type-2 family protein [Promethearchaeota archaeon]
MDEEQLYLRKIALKTLERAISAVQPKQLIERAIKVQGNNLIIQDDEYDLKNFKKIYIIGGGKATAEMAFTLENLLLSLNENEYEGIINIPRGSLNIESVKKSKITINYASHPIPDESGLKGVKSMIKMVENSKKNELIFCLISGGGSALLPLPKPGINLDDLKKLNSLLLASGASIHEINIIRKHLSEIKGGNLAKKFFQSDGAKLISLIISDVVGDNLDSIASGPTAPDQSTFKDALGVLDKYEIIEKIPSSIKDYLQKGLTKEDYENPKPNDIIFGNVHNYLIGSVKFAVDEILKITKDKSFMVEYFSNEIIGEAHEYGRILYDIIKNKTNFNNNFKKSGKIILIGTGELTVTVKGNGIGGRNQEMLLSFLESIESQDIDHKFLVLGANLDGVEGNSEAMGAIVDNYVLHQMNEKQINPAKYLDTNDSNAFFKLVESEIITGPTGCNVNDLLLILLKR